MKRTGVYKYAQHRDTGIWCMAYAFDDADVLLWREGDPVPVRVAEHVLSGGEMRAWNAMFERVMWKHVLGPQHGFPTPDLSQWYDTMADAAAMSLPLRLDKCATVLRAEQKKDEAGHRLMLKMCRPRSFGEDGTPVWWDQVEKLAKLYEYCKQDVRTERAIMRLTNRLKPREREVYLLDQRINDRGVPLDLALVTAARETVQREVEIQNAKLVEATSGAVTKVTQVGKLKTWLAEQGIDATSLDKQAVADLLEPGKPLPDSIRNGLEARREAGKSSLAKLDSMIDVVGTDGALHGLLQYHAASTGRWGGRLVQPHNFPRGNDVKNVESYIPMVLGREPWAAVSKLQVISAMLRGMMVAAPGHELQVADFAGVEARVLAWLAQDETMLTLFREGRPVYKEMAAFIYRCKPEEIEKPSERYQLGKNTILGCGYGMGKKTFAKTTGVSEEEAERAVRGYREMFPNVPRYWYKVNDAVVAAVREPGTVLEVNGSKFTQRGGYLWIVLPSKRPLAYAKPKLVERPLPWDNTQTRPAVEYSGMNSYTHQWERLTLYGGLIAENIDQAVARDLLADAMLRTEAAGYPNILTVHDEIVTMPERGKDFETFMRLMKATEPWSSGIPVDAEGWRGERYRK